MKATHTLETYIAPDGTQHYEWFAVGEFPDTITVGADCCVHKDVVNNSRNVDPWRNGWVSNAAGVMPYQRIEAMKAAADAGCPTYYNKDGDPEVRGGRRNRSKFLKAMGFFDKEAGYSDYAGDH